jgi:two-component system, OmpR family, response regulator
VSGRPSLERPYGGAITLTQSYVEEKSACSRSRVQNSQDAANSGSFHNAAEVIAPDLASMRRVLLVENDEILRRNYKALLSAHGFEVRTCATKSDAIVAFNQERFDVIIFDVTLNVDYETDLSICQVFRERQRMMPIIVLTEHEERPNTVKGVLSGADDYLSKTTSTAFLVARINALIGRMEALTSGASDSENETSAEGGSHLHIDERLSRAYWLRSMLDLSLTQFWILQDLFEHHGEVRSTVSLMRAANISVQPNTIVVHIKAIRKAIQKITPDFACIKSERAGGYRWIEDGLRSSQSASQ